MISRSLIIRATLAFASLCAVKTLANTGDYTAAPPFLVGEAGKPNVVIALDISGSMKLPAYRSTGNWRTVTHDDFDPNKEYFGYFEIQSNYTYSQTNGGFFYIDENGAWNGNFLNWLTMRRMDVARKVLVGGKVRNREGESINNETWFLIEGQNEPADYTFKKQYAQSSTVSPIANNVTLLISNGNISQANNTSAQQYRIALAVKTEPTGIIQENAGSMRFGVAVYNYDLSQKSSKIYEGNKVNGGTFRPCYPDTRLPKDQRTNYDICLDTHVKAPLSNIIDVIEDHPLIWGTTPIAETLYEIKGYFGQINHTATRGHPHWYNNGSNRNSYEVNNAWDPYYYEEIGGKAPCAKSFVIHFNDGEPFRDWDGNGHPITITGDGRGTILINEALDDVAYDLRNQDCRTDDGMTGHQGIISYYVYAALGENEDNNGSTRKMREAAVNGGFVDEPNSGNLNAPDPLHPTNFINYINSGRSDPSFCSDPDGDGLIETIEWDRDFDCNPDTFYFANDGAMLVSKLNAVFQSIALRSASGGASSVISASSSGEGAVYNAIFQTSAERGEDSVSWIGDVHALMIDAGGNLRADGDGDKVLDDDTVDGYLDYCTEENGNIRVVRVKITTDGNRPTQNQFQNCSQNIFSLGLLDLSTNYLWSASTWLDQLSDLEATNQRTYSSANDGRYIFTAINAEDDNVVLGSDAVPFVESTFSDTNAGLLESSSASDARNLVNWVRGQDLTGFRSRQLDGVTKRLADIIYSTPTAVGRPAENLDLLYGSNSYRNFLLHYKNRRQVIYAGTNGGMLHAFNGGWYNAATQTFQKARGNSAAGSTTEYDLGAELWAYVPYHALPHLKYLATPGYGAVVSDHVSLVDLKPRIFDAKIFPDDANHPGGWGTILVGGMRLGGGTITVDMDNDGTDDRTLRSSIFILDITNPDEAPTLLLEFSHPNLGFTTAIPSPIVHGASNNEGDDATWYLILGSGPDNTPEGFDDVKSTQNAHLFLLNLNNIVSGQGDILESNFDSDGIMELTTEPNTFISDISAVDFGLDKMTTDALYFGSVSGDPLTGWSGKIHRLLIQNETQTTQNAVSDWAVTTLYDAGLPITAAPSPSFDNARNRWVYVGAGRFFTSEDRSDTTAHQYFGIKEPRNTDGSYAWTTVSNLVDVTNTLVAQDTAVLTSPPTLTPALPDPARLPDLESRFLNYKNSTNYLSGWSRTFEAGERNFGAATLLGNLLTFTTYNPEDTECTIDGQAKLYVLNALTGTADDTNVIGIRSATGDYEYEVDLGSMPATTPSLHTGEGYNDSGSTKAIIQKSDGSFFTQEQEGETPVQSGEASWRRLK